MAILGLSLSIFFFTSVIFLGDSIDATMTAYLSSSSDSDINFSSPSQFFDYDNMSKAVSSSMDDYAVSFPRMSFGFTSQIEEGNVGMGRFFALDFAYEHNLEFGFNEDAISIRHDNFTKSVYQGLPNNQCLISDRFSERNQLSVSSILSVTLSSLKTTLNFTVVGIYQTVDEAGLGKRHHPDIIVDLPHFWDRLDLNVPLNDDRSWDGQINTMIIDFEPQSEFYTFNTMDATEQYLQEQGANTILVAEGISPTIHDWTLEYKQFKNARNSQTAQILVTAMTFFVGLSAIFLSSTLIYSILTTSLNERIREFGIQRTIGASKNQILKNIILQGILIGVFGSLLGSIGSTVLFIVLRHILGSLNLLVVILHPINILIGFCLGFFISIFVSVLPARYVYSIPLIRSLYPDRYIESNISSLIKQKKLFGYLFLIGSVLSLVGLFVFVSLPNIMISGKYDLFLNLLSITLFCVMIGFILLGLGLLPALIHGILSLASPLIQTIKNFLKMSIFRHNRRNQLTNLMLIFSFSLIVFTSSFITNITNQMITQKQIKIGSTMVLKSSDRSLLPMQITNDIREIEGVESTSAILRTINKDGFHYPGNTPDSQQLSLSVSDIGGISAIDVFSVAVDEDFNRTIYQDITLMKEGIFEEGFASLFCLDCPSAIIADTLAESLEVSLNDSIRLNFQKNHLSTEIIVNIVGIYNQIPAVRSIEEFNKLSEQSFDYLSDDGILISHSLFNQGFGLTTNDNDLGYASRIIVKVRENWDENEVVSQIYALVTDVNFEILTTTQWVYQDQNLFTMIKYGVALLLFIFIFTAVSNLSLSAYSIFMERQAEIRTLRGIGLSIKDVERVFFIELLILLLANGVVGAVAGGFMALTFSSLGEAIYRVKTPFTLSYDLLLALFVISIIFLKLSYRRLFRRKIETKLLSNLTI